MTVVVTGRNSVPPGWPGDALGRRHLLWIPGAAALGFLSSFLFADVWRLPVAVYHLAYFGLAGSFFALYTIRTGLRVSAVTRRRLPLALALGMLGGLVLTRQVLADPPGAGPSGLRFAWDLLWRGLIYGAVDGALLSAFPWLVTWRALGGESAPLGKRVWLTLLALSSALIVTSAYHLGYPDFRGPKLVQANVGNAIASLPTLLSANPLASPLAHAGLHLAAVAHNPESDLFLPPHTSSVASNGRSAERSPQSPIIEFPLGGAWQLFQPPGHPREAFDFVALDASFPPLEFAARFMMPPEDRPLHPLHADPWPVARGDGLAGLRPGAPARPVDGAPGEPDRWSCLGTVAPAAVLHRGHVSEPPGHRNGLLLPLHDRSPPPVGPDRVDLQQRGPEYAFGSSVPLHDQPEEVLTLPEGAEYHRALWTTLAAVAVVLRFGCRTLGRK